MYKRIVSIFLIICFLLSFDMVLLAVEKTKTDSDTLSEGVVYDTSSENSYSDYLSLYGSKKSATAQIEISCNTNIENTPFSFDFKVEEDGLYTIGMKYSALDEKTGELSVNFKLDGKNPYSEAEDFEFPKMWTNDLQPRVDGSGNEFAPANCLYEDTFENIATDSSGWSTEPYYVYLTAGIHTVAISTDTPFALDTFFFGVPEETENYKAPSDSSDYYDGDDIIIEGESSQLKNSYWISAQTDATTPNVAPSQSGKILLNYIGGSNWKSVGDTIYWETPELEAGYYNIGFNYLQNTVLGSNCYRSLKIDGKTPFTEATSIAYAYKTGWTYFDFSDKENTPYLFYFSAGKHTISLTVTLGETKEICDVLQEATSILGDLYIDISMITGETVDVYRDYDLFDQIPSMEDRLKQADELLDKASEMMKEISGSSSGSYASSVLSMQQSISQMLNNKYTAHRYKSNYYSNYTALCSNLNDMRDMPIGIDKIILSSPNRESSFKKAGFISSSLFSLKRIVFSFINDYNTISEESTDGESITVWVNWGRDQAQVLNSLIQTTFTQTYGISVNVELVNASMVQGVLSGKAPDVFLQHSRTEPVNLAMRGVLYDLSQFDNCDEILSRFHDGAEEPYRYKGGLYALPDTQVFYAMFYRKDIFEKLGLSVPKTWDEFASLTALLARDNLDVYLPYTQITDMSMVNTGVGSLSIFPSLLLQNGLDLYTEDLHGTTLSSQSVISVFTSWTEYYTKKKIPVSINFYNRFRTGTCPIGITTYTFYTTLKAAASEIDGMWGVAPIPGTVQEDGTISNVSAGGGTGCGILKSCKNPELAWKFLDWWTSEDTQLAYSNNVEALLGSTGRVAVSNTNAFMEQDWESEDLEQLLIAWNQTKELPEVPGSYYVSRSIDHSFWNVINNNENPKDMLLKWGAEVDDEIERKWNQYENQ